MCFSLASEEGIRVFSKKSGRFSLEISQFWSWDDFGEPDRFHEIFSEIGRSAVLG
jgi:hypothetical protein